MEFRIYVDINALFDMRYGRMKMSLEGAPYLVAQKFKEYVNRPHDNLTEMFPTLPKTWNNIQLSKELLKNSPRTGVIALIEQAITSASNVEKKYDRVRVSLNTRGLLTTEKEREAFVRLLSTAFSGKHEVELVDKTAPKAKWFKRNFELAIIYDIDEVVTTIKESEAPLTSPLFYAPFRIKEGKSFKDWERMTKAMGIKTDPLQFTEDSLGSLLMLNFMDMRYFSTVWPS